MNLNWILKYVNVFADLLWLNIVLLIGCLLAVNHIDLYLYFHRCFLFVSVINMVWLFSASYCRIYSLYQKKNVVTFYDQMVKAFIIFTLGIILVKIMLIVWNHGSLQQQFGFWFFILFFLVFFIGLTMNRVLLLRLRKYPDRFRKRYRKKIVLVGGNATSQEMRERLIHKSATPYEVVGVFYDGHRISNSTVNGLYKGQFESVFPYLEEHRVDEIFCIAHGMKDKDVLRLREIADSKVMRFQMLMDIYGYLPAHGQFEVINDIPVFSARTEPLEKIENAFLKRCFDLCFSSLVILLLLSWLLPILSLLIYLDSPGPIFFKQKRVGRNNKLFTCLKLRTMRMNKEADEVMAKKDDPRVTKMGNLLRKTSLDELPQFFNVWWGSMSVVGPRPHMMADIKLYSSMNHRYMVRHFLKPGITGLAQIKASRAETKTPDAVRRRTTADVYYLENWSFILDLKIIFLTFWQIVSRNEDVN